MVWGSGPILGPMLGLVFGPKMAVLVCRRSSFEAVRGGLGIKFPLVGPSVGVNDASGTEASFGDLPRA